MEPKLGLEECAGVGSGHTKAAKGWSRDGACIIPGAMGVCDVSKARSREILCNSTRKTLNTPKAKGMKERNG